ncbi:MAG: hypothetical protein AVDCRST_MAG89-1092, partial [uncultured Gemmatimonadetes bacterium]
APARRLDAGHSAGDGRGRPGAAHPGKPRAPDSGGGADGPAPWRRPPAAVAGARGGADPRALHERGGGRHAPAGGRTPGAWVRGAASPRDGAHRAAHREPARPQRRPPAPVAGRTRPTAAGL